jgi:hypothetical protein
LAIATWTFVKTSHKEIHDGKKYEMVIASPSGCEAISLKKEDSLLLVKERQAREVSVSCDREFKRIT